MRPIARPLLLTALLATTTATAACSLEESAAATSATALTDPAITAGSVWEVWDRGTEPPAGWKLGPQHFSEVWRQGRGPLGYGESYIYDQVDPGPNPQRKHLTTYFRRGFAVDASGTVTALAAEVMYDDGFVAYVNGVEIGRAFMPDGPITPTTLARGHETGDQHEHFDWSEAAPILHPGLNWLAIEVHQHDPASSDLTFDLALALSR